MDKRGKKGRTRVSYTPTPVFAMALVMVLALAALVVYGWQRPVALSADPVNPGDGARKEVRVRYVIDGDTIILASGKRVRYVGIDTPERGENLYGEAKGRNGELLGGGSVTFEACRSEPKDKYGRLLGWVYVDGVDVGGELLREGLARTLSIPPCGLRKKREFKALEAGAKKMGVGIWSGASR